MAFAEWAFGFQIVGVDIAFDHDLGFGGHQKIWEELGLPPITPETPWHGYSLGNWMDRWDEMADRAVKGDYMETGRRSFQMRRNDVSPATSVRKMLDPNAADDSDGGE